MQLVETGYGQGMAADLIAEIQQEMTRRYGGPDETPVDPREFLAPEGVFVVAVLEGRPVGCAGLRRHGAGDVELKRLYVRAGHRRRGLAAALLAAMEERARLLGYRRLILETGTGQPEALALYEHAGYQPIPGFGLYADAPESRSYAKVLRPSSAEAPGSAETPCSAEAGLLD